VKVLLEDPVPVTLVCGPAGSGKTSLLTQFAVEVASAGDALAWLSLDEQDNDPTALWGAIVASLEATGRVSDASRLRTLVAPPRYVEGAFIDLVLQAVGPTIGRLWLVLDDLHVVRTAEALESIEALVRRLPARVHLVISSRSDPPINLPRLRVQGRLRELRATELYFTAAETDAFLQTRGIPLPETAVHAIHDRTAGWAAGVALAAIALADSDDGLALLERFSGDDHAVADYLGTEVLASMPDDLRTFLAATSICSKISVGLARQLTGRDDAAAVLEGLVRDGALTERVGRGRDVFRYHDLLRTYLTAELHRSRRSQFERGLHQVAGTWWADHGEPLHAIKHLARAGDDERLEQVAAEHVLGVILDGRAELVVQTFGYLANATRSRPMLALLGAVATLQLDDADEADRWLSEIDTPSIVADAGSPHWELAVSVLLARSRLGGRQDLDLAQLEALLASKALGDTGHPDLDLYALYHRGVARGYLGQHQAAVADLERATVLARTSHRTAFLVECISFLAGALALSSDLVGMRSTAGEAIELAGEHGWTQSVGLANAHLLQAWSAFLRGDQARAAPSLANAHAASRRYLDPALSSVIAAFDVVVVAAGGEGAYAALRDFQAAAARRGDAPAASGGTAYVAPSLVRVCLDLGEVGVARRFADDVSRQLPGTGERALLRAMLLHEAGRHDLARKELEPVLRARTPCLVITTDIRVRLLAAELEANRSNAARCHELVCDALRLAEPVEVVQPFLELDRVREHLEAGQGRFGRAEAFARRVRAVASDHDAVLVRRPHLTPAELAVLRELPSLLTLREIAETRSLSPNTVKSHVRSIYRKLGVSGRREAVEIGRRLDLL
jgi:LuxR family transcriptional regulator, maltose regulon positive regulatory protein